MTSEVYIVRAVCKLSSAIDNLDELEACDKKFFTGKFNRDFRKFLDFFHHHTDLMLKEMVKQDWSAYCEIMDRLEDVDICVDADTEELKHIGLLVGKIASAIQDLKKVEDSLENRLFTGPLLGRSKPLLGKGYVKRLPVDHNGMKRIVELTCEIGEEVISN